MRIMMVLICCFAFFPPQHAAAADMQELELTDGGTIIAEVLSLADGVYTLRSATLGTLRINASRIRAIRRHGSAGHAGEGQVGANSAGSLEELQGKMLNDPGVMALIQSLQNDPEFQRILEDPETMKAVNAGDVSALLANPRFMKLLNNATVKEIQKKVE